MTKADPEATLLNACVRLSLTAGKPEETIARLLASVNWQRLLWLGRQQGVLLILDNVLNSHRLVGVCPPLMVAQLRILREVNQLRSLACARELCQLQALFDEQDIRAVSLDRWMLTRSAGGRPDLIEPGTTRRYLIAAEDRERASAVLAEAGHPLEADPQKLIKSGLSPVILDTARDGRWWVGTLSLEFGGRQHRHLSWSDWLQRQARRVKPQSEIPLIHAYEMVLLHRRVEEKDRVKLLVRESRPELDRTIGTLVVGCYERLELAIPASLAGCGTPTPAPDMSHSGDISIKPTIAAPFLPTPPIVAMRMLKLARTAPGDLVCDLGCGDGRIAIAAARDFGARGVGVDCNPERIAEARASANVLALGERAIFRCGNLFEVNLGEADVITCYLLPALMPGLLEKLRREAKPGTCIVSHDYIFPDWEPENTEIIRAGQMKVSQIYLWRVPSHWGA